jgi:hypothetical protein
MRSALLRFGSLAVFLAVLLAVMYVAVQNRSDETEVILYDQYNHVSAAGWGAFSEIANGQKDGSEQVADDFVVPAGQTWTANQVEVAGIYVYDFNGERVQALDITLYQDSNALPGTEISAQHNLTYTVFPPDSAEVQVIPVPPIPSPGADTTGGSFLIPISPVALPSGVYWLSVQADLNRTQEREPYDWLWQWRTVIANHPSLHRQYLGPAYYKQYPDLVATGGWTGWARESKCIQDPSADICGDLVFRLRGHLLSGVLGPTETPTYPLPTTMPTGSPTPTEPTSTTTPIPPSDTSTPTNLPTRTPEAIPTNTIKATTRATFTSVPTSLPTATAIATLTTNLTITPTTTLTITPTITPTNTPSVIPKLVPTGTPTIEAAVSPTIYQKGGSIPVSPTETVTATVTATPTQPTPQKQPPPKP